MVAHLGKARKILRVVPEGQIFHFHGILAIGRNVGESFGHDYYQLIFLAIGETLTE